MKGVHKGYDCGNEDCLKVFDPATENAGEADAGLLVIIFGAAILVAALLCCCGAAIQCRRAARSRSALRSTPSSLQPAAAPPGAL